MEAIVRHILAIDYVEAKLDEELSKIRMPREELSKDELLEIIFKTKKAYEDYRNKVKYHREGVLKNILKFAESEDLRDIVLKSIDKRMLETKSEITKYILERNERIKDRNKDFSGFTTARELMK